MPSLWHNAWQNRFADREVVHARLPGGSQARRADAMGCGGRVVIEVQHSYIKRDEVDARGRDYGLHGKRVVWVIDGDEGVRVERLGVSDTCLLVFEWRCAWKYASFTGAADVFVCHGGAVFQVPADKVRSRMIDVFPGVPEDEFVAALREDGTDALDALWAGRSELPQGTLYVNQRGAGCGKTYESIQLILDDRFKQMNTFIYLTKAHSAKSVIHEEFKNQLEASKLVVAGRECLSTGNGQVRQVKYNIDRSADDRVSMIIGTIDSFMFALRDTGAIISGCGEGGYFGNLMETIKGGPGGGYGPDGGFRYAAGRPQLSRECLVVIDEAQDLPPKYVETMARLMRDTSIDVYVIGDKLQSIGEAGANNVITLLEREGQLSENVIGNDGDGKITCLEREGMPRTNVVFSKGANVIRRFHNEEIMRFVNSSINFEEYGLPEIAGICKDAGTCGHPHNAAPAVRLFEQPRGKRGGDRKSEAVLVEEIVGKLSKEVDANGYLPRNFMFIFPFMKCNTLAECLETRLDDFWIQTFSKPDYQRQVLSRDPYWKDKVGDGDFYRHAFLHRSEEGCPINLDESEHGTRLMSIHSAKGTGREVVFLLDMSDARLKRFSRGEVDLVYESLLHVAITRQKRTLYIGLPDMGDNVRARFTRDREREVVSSTVLEFPRKAFMPKAVFEVIERRSDLFKKLEDTCFAPRRLRELVDEGGGSEPSEAGEGELGGRKRQLKKPVDMVEWGHHVIRYNAMLYVLFQEVSNTSRVGDQMRAILRDIVERPVQKMKHADYYDSLYQGLKNARGKPCIPVLQFDAEETSKYSCHCEDIVRIVERVQKKLKESWMDTGRMRLPELCPIETCVAVHVINLLRRGQRADFPITELYQIVYSMTYVDGTPHDDDYGCLCEERLCGQHVRRDSSSQGAGGGDVEGLRKSVANHHLVIEQVRGMFKQSMEKMGDNPSNVTFNIQHTLDFGGSDEKHFKMFNPCIQVIATSATRVVLYALQPSLNCLTCDKVFIQALLDTFLACNSPETSNNHKRFHNKRVSVCVFTLDHAVPVWIELGPLDKATDAAVRECIEATLMERFQKTNRTLWDKFQEFVVKCDGRQSAAFKLLQGEVTRVGGKGGEDIPSYVSTFLDVVEARSSDAKRCMFTGQEDLDATLKRRIREWLDLDEPSDW